MAATIQRDLNGNVIQLTTGKERCLIKVSRHTSEVLGRASGAKPFDQIQIAELGTKVAVLILNKFPTEDVKKILATNDLQVIEQTILDFYIKNDQNFP